MMEINSKEMSKKLLTNKNLPQELLTYEKRETSQSHMDKDEEAENSSDKVQIKSDSLVKFEACKVPTFSKLEWNTDLNLPPSNWLANDGYGLKQVAFHPGGFSSFKMANMFLETISDVDVISDAENIKRILKLPYSQKSVISMIVHRVNNTLLIDEFDIHKYLLRQVNEDWNWLRSFIVEHILNSMNEKERSIFLKSKGASRDVLQKMNLMTKFLYYSVQEDDEKTDTDKQTKHDEEKIINAIKQQRLANLSNHPRLPDPETSEHLPRSQQHNRNVIWTFEDIRMLIGTDIPIFGDENRPCITLKLRDMNKPINVLTGIDYWLDNLMCNVPELVMCYHLDGLVQKYELIKTEDLPYLDDCQFSPRVIRNVAQNVLSFLKANATKPGHTYWLFKGKNDDVVKLYDLTTLCKDESVDKNPFTIPVAMLLYTVAKNIRQSSKTLNAKIAGTVRSLLENCIKLLPKEKYPQIVTSSYYMLSDLFVPANIDPKSPKFCTETQADDDIDESSNFDEEDIELESEDTNIYEGPENKLDHVMKSIKETLTDYKQGSSDGQKLKASPPPLSITDVIERCSLALNHIASGLSCLQYFDTSEEEKAKEQEKQKRLYEEQHPNMANPYQSIPLPYEPLKHETNTETNKAKNLRKKTFNKQDSADSVKEENEGAKSVLPLAANEIIERSWNTHLKLLLYEKAEVTYVTKAENAYANESYGVALKYFYASIKCHQLIKKYLPDITSRRNWFLSRAGDCFYQFSININKLDKYLEGFEMQSDTDRIIMIELCKEVQEDCLPKPTANVEELLQISCAFYESACENEEMALKTEHLRRLACIKNDLGNRYMSQAQTEYEKYLKLQDEKGENAVKDENETSPVYKILLMKCYDAFNCGISLFEEVKDTTNLILMLTNMGRFMRVRAHTPLPGEKTNDSNLVKKFYNEAFSCYQRALGIIGSRKENPDLWDIISWELSGATFNYAKTLQDYGLTDDRLSTEEVEHVVVEALQKALRLCNTETVSSKQILYTFRAGLIHHRLGSLYHNNLRHLSGADEAKRKTCLTLCRMHYEKSAKIFLNLKEPKEFLELQLKRVAVTEHLVECGTTSNQKIKHLLSALDLFHETTVILSTIKEIPDPSQQETGSQEEILKLLELFEQRLQFCLRTLTKLYLTNSSNSKKESGKTLNKYKSMFAVTLRQQTASKLSPKALAEHLITVLTKINQLKNG